MLFDFDFSAVHNGGSCSAHLPRPWAASVLGGSAASKVLVSFQMIRSLNRCLGSLTGFRLGKTEFSIIFKHEPSVDVRAELRILSCLSICCVAV